MKIYSKRYYLKSHVYDLVYEWEDDMQTQFGYQLITFNIFKIPILIFAKILLKIKIIDNTNSYFDFIDDIFIRFFTHEKILRLDISPRRNSYLSNSQKRVVPFIIDYDKSFDKYFKAKYSKFPLIVVSSLNAFEYLKLHFKQNQMIHFPLTLPSKYKLDKKVFFGEKKFDFILPGRPNKEMILFLEKFAKKNDIEYLYYKSINNRTTYISNKGTIINCSNRVEYFNLLMQCKIASYSTQGIDGNSFSFDHITSKLFEIIYSGCICIGRYKKTEESVFFELDKVVFNISTYEEFEEIMNLKMNENRTDFIYNTYHKFINSNRLSFRLKSSNFKKIIS